MKFASLTFSILLLLFDVTGCAAVPAVIGYAGSGGITLYKKATESGPKAEFVLIKVEIHHDTYTTAK